MNWIIGTHNLFWSYWTIISCLSSNAWAWIKCITPRRQQLGWKLEAYQPFDFTEVNFCFSALYQVALYQCHSCCFCEWWNAPLAHSISGLQYAFSNFPSLEGLGRHLSVQEPVSDIVRAYVVFDMAIRLCLGLLYFRHFRNFHLKTGRRQVISAALQRS